MRPHFPTLKTVVLACLALVMGLLLAPGIAAACPACTGQNDRLSDTLKLVGCFMLVPFVVAGVVIKVIRTLSRDDQTPEHPISRR